MTDMRQYKTAMKELRGNDRKMGEVIKELLARPKENLKQWFPSKHGIQVRVEDGYVLLTGPVPLARDDNSCWSINAQMDLWHNYLWDYLWGNGVFSVVKKTEDGRHLAEIRHIANAEIPFIPNTIEAHAYINGLAWIIGMSDSMEKMDYSVSYEIDRQQQEHCEIRIYSNPKQEDAFCKLVLPKPPETDDALGQEIAEKIDFDNPPELKALSMMEIMSLYNYLLLRSEQIRKAAPYVSMMDYYPLKQDVASVRRKDYRKRLKEKGFLVNASSEGDRISFISDENFRSISSVASTEYVVALYQFLLDRPEMVEQLKEKRRTLIIRNGVKIPDGDNIPFDSIYRVFCECFEIEMDGRVQIQYVPSKTERSVLILQAV